MTPNQCSDCCGSIGSLLWKKSNYLQICNVNSLSERKWCTHQSGHPEGQPPPLVVSAATAIGGCSCLGWRRPPPLPPPSIPLTFGPATYQAYCLSPLKFGWMNYLPDQAIHRLVNHWLGQLLSLSPIIFLILISFLILIPFPILILFQIPSMISISNNHPTIPHMRTALGQTPHQTLCKVLAVLVCRLQMQCTTCESNSVDKYANRSEVAKATLQYFCQSSVARLWSNKCCNWGSTESLQWRVDESTPMEACQLPGSLLGKPPLEYFCQSSIAILLSNLSCNTCWTRILQQRIDKNIAMWLWPLQT